ncbi:MAG TPA: type II toxin-antitoxin system HipA family toxin [Solirubrobacteraceae bacterium]|jgi:serine/threonine-protein kinase HipA|nr:type II toxin-antitoxin system HipA family toxin [Solirubrobacteraceae bacterium]
MTTLAAVRLWGTAIGAASMPEGSTTAIFQYQPTFIESGIELSPLVMPLRAEPYTFPALNPESFRGLPGLLADSLPDRYGNALIDTWLAGQGRDPESFDAVKRLCYIGTRGMGALEYEPSQGPAPAPDHDLQIAELVELASEVLSHRQKLVSSLADGDREQAMLDILSVGMSAGGARAKAVIAWNPATNVIRSGQLDGLGPDFEYWLLKFDGVRNNRDRELLADPQGYGAIEYAYSLMAKEAGITMADCRLLEEGGRRHFMTRRFDRTAGGTKVHMQSLAALAHLDFNQPGAHSYEQALLAMRRLGLQTPEVEQMFRRMLFNVVARNQDDHVKNIAFLMSRSGKWQLAPAFDVAYAYQPRGPWTSQHQMSLNGKRDNFTLADFDAIGRTASLPRGRAARILDDVRQVVAQWNRYAVSAAVDEEHVRRIAPTLRLSFPAD